MPYPGHSTLTNWSLQFVVHEEPMRKVQALLCEASQAQLKSPEYPDQLAQGPETGLLIR